MKFCASSPRRQRITSPSSLLEVITSMREGNSRGVKVCLIKRPQAGVLELRKKKNQGVISTPYEGGAESVPLSDV